MPRDELYSLPGEIEFVYVIEGTLELIVGEERLTLGEGDALTYELSRPHTWRNPSSEERLRVLWVAVPNRTNPDRLDSVLGFA